MKPYYGVGRENVLWDVNTTSSFVFFVIRDEVESVMWSIYGLAIRS